MILPRQQRNVGWCFLSCSSLLLAASAHINLEPVRTIPPSSLFSEFQAMETRRAEAILREPVNSWEDSIAQAIAADLTLHYDLRPTGRSGVWTTREGSADLMFVSWRSAGHTDVKGVSVWDTPTDQYVLLECDRRIFESTRRLTQYLEALIRWRSGRFVSPGPFSALNGVLIESPDHANEQQLVLDAAMPVLQLADRSLERHAVRILGWTTMQRAIVAIYAPKVSNPAIYPDGSVGVGERFPPLRERVVRWTVTELLSEIGKGYDGLHLGTLSNTRDAILIRELLRRGPDDATLLRILAPDTLAGHALNARIIDVLELLVQEKLTSTYSRALRRAINLLLDRPATAGAAETLLGQLTAVADVDISDVAIESIARGRMVGRSILYLAQHGSTEAIYSSLEKLNIPHSLESDRRDALQKIRARLAAR